MARGRKAKATAAAAVKRKIKEEADASGPAAKLQRADSENTQIRKAAAEVLSSEASAGSSKSAPLDVHFATHLNVSDGKAFEDYSCMLNQTDIINNNNKFYVIQIAKIGKKFHVFNRWGRVGETGQMSFSDFSKEDDAVKAFCKKFCDKTGNKWEARDQFVPKSKKYTMLAMDESGDDDGMDAVDGGVSVKKEVKTEAGDVLPSSLDPRTQLAIQLLFNSNMFEAQMSEMKLDVRKMPLGKLSKAQIAKGLSALVDVEEAVKNKASYETIANLTSRFYTLIPHDFGRTNPPVLQSLDVIRQKKDVMLTLSDIELTQSLQKTDKAGTGKKVKNPIDEHYESLKCEMRLIPSTAAEFKQYSQPSEPSSTINYGVNSTTKDEQHKQLRVPTAQPN
ncbi:WGR domain [Trinorchestia longiramus]|nr:WGR domain [Trinorchestia longiramus]